MPCRASMATSASAGDRRPNASRSAASARIQHGSSTATRRSRPYGCGQGCLPGARDCTRPAPQPRGAASRSRMAPKSTTARRSGGPTGMACPGPARGSATSNASGGCQCWPVCSRPPCAASALVPRATPNFGPGRADDAGRPKTTLSPRLGGQGSPCSMAGAIRVVVLVTAALVTLGGCPTAAMNMRESIMPMMRVSHVAARCRRSRGTAAAPLSATGP